MLVLSDVLFLFNPWRECTNIIPVKKSHSNLKRDLVMLCRIFSNSKQISGPNLNRACLINPLDSATNIIISKSKELSIDHKDHIIDFNFSGKYK